MLLTALADVQRADLLAVLGLALLLPALRWVLTTAVFGPVARLVLVPRSMRQLRALPDKLTRKRVKMCESMWKLFSYGSLLCLEATITHKEPWFWRRDEYWADWPHQRELPLMRVLFALQLAYYISTTFMLAVWEVPRKDYWVMQLHHGCTLVAIAYNYISGYQRFGCLIMMLHDTTDVIMEVAKCLNYASQPLAANAVFVLFVASWVGLRLYAFPAYVIRSTLLDSRRVLGYTPPHYWLLNGLLCALCVIHVYWFGLILRVLWMTVTAGQAKDIREDDDDDGSGGGE